MLEWAAGGTGRKRRCLGGSGPVVACICDAGECLRALWCCHCESLLGSVAEGNTLDCSPGLGTLPVAAMQEIINDQLDS